MTLNSLTRDQVLLLGFRDLIFHWIQEIVLYIITMVTGTAYDKESCLLYATVRKGGGRMNGIKEIFVLMFRFVASDATCKLCDKVSTVVSHYYDV